MELENASTEIRSFYSIKEINEALEEEMEQLKSVADEYSLWLGSFLRGSKGIQQNEEWAKKMAAFQKAPAKSKTNVSKEIKGKKAAASGEWVQFKEIRLSATEQGEAEILFEAVEELNGKIEQISKVIASLAELEKSGFGKDTVYVTYFHNGVPEKIVLRANKDQEFLKKFQYIADFSVQSEV